MAQVAMLVLLSLLSLWPLPAELVKRALPLGDVQGRCREGVCEFLHLRYASAPLGSLRWRAPVAPVEVQAEEGAMCSQVQGKQVLGSEDCLFLNVWSPVDCESCAVMFWIHGGAFESGGIQDAFNGTALARKGVVVVTANYRLGILGFGGSEVLRGRHASGATGNYGLEDQRFALAWVKEHIKALGGSADRVTLFGQSAGAASIAVHLTAPESWGLFQQAIMESGAFAYWNVQPMEDAERQFQGLLDSCDRSLGCLLALDAAELTRRAAVPRGRTAG